MKEPFSIKTLLLDMFTPLDQPVRTQWIWAAGAFITTGVSGHLIRFVLGTKYEPIWSIFLLICMCSMLCLFVILGSIWLKVTKLNWKHMPYSEPNETIAVYDLYTFYEKVESKTYPNLSFVGKTGVLLYKRTHGNTYASDIQDIINSILMHVHSQPPHERWLNGVETLLADPKHVQTFTYLYNLITDEDTYAMINDPSVSIPRELDTILHDHIAHLTQLNASIEYVLNNMDSIKLNEAFDKAIRLNAWSLDELEPVRELPKLNASSDDWLKRSVKQFESTKP